MNIFVGNLSSEVNENDLRKAFESFGEVTSASVITDKYTRQSKGFGFVEMPSKTEAQSAIEGLNGGDFKGKTLTVNEARPRPDGGAGKGYKGRGPGAGRRF
jgi:RNA recognition motif-containing protein